MALPHHMPSRGRDEEDSADPLDALLDSYSAQAQAETAQKQRRCVCVLIMFPSISSILFILRTPTVAMVELACRDPATIGLFNLSRSSPPPCYPINRVHYLSQFYRSVLISWCEEAFITINFHSYMPTSSCP